MKRKLVTVDAETLLATPMSKTMFIVDGLIPQGVNVLSGAAKIGNSFKIPKVSVINFVTEEKKEVKSSA